MKVALLLVWSFLTAIPVVSSLSCLSCHDFDCGPPPKCKGGTVLDICGCCKECAKLEGEICGGDWGELGSCDSGLKCVHRICTNVQKSPKPCTVSKDILGRRVNDQSDCPRGFWCKVQFPGIPDAGIPDLAVCVKGKPPAGRVATTPKASTVAASNLQGHLPDECKHLPNAGPCKAAFPRWYYNLAKRKCKEFLYGGCDGNANNFHTEAACKSFCMQQNASSFPLVKHTVPPQIKEIKGPERPIVMWQDVCILPKVTGPCRASFSRWYFDPFRRKCFKFAYGGCSGNMNNFSTKAECKIRCMKRRVKTRARAAVIWYGALRRRGSASRKFRQG